MAVVAPFVGAWIEIVVACIFSNVASVAPFVGAWIEMDKLESILANGVSLRSSERGLKLSGCGAICMTVKVAPFVGAWIEIALWTT